MSRILLVILASLLATVALADDQEAFRIGNDAFLAGQTISHSTSGTDDLFAAGQRIRVTEGVGGNAHLAGQSLSLRGPVGADLYAFGQDVSVAEDVGGNALIAGQDIVISGAVAGSLRAAGASIEIGAPVGGYALIAGQSVTLDAPVSGDVSLTVEDITFGSGARIDGTLTIYEEEVGELDVPENVVPASRITRHKIDDWEGRSFPSPVPTFRDMVRRFLGGVVIVALLAALIAALIPEQLADMRRRILAAPFRTLAIGFIAQSAVIGSIFIVAMTLVGLILVPGILLLAFVGVLAGYVVGAYAFGVGLILLFGQDEPDTLGERAIAAAAGALAVGVVGLIPFLGWLFIVALALTGLGAIVLQIAPRWAGQAEA